MNLTRLPKTFKLSNISIALVCVNLIACGSDNNSDELATAIKLESQRQQGTIIESVTIVGDQKRLRAGESHQLTATGIDSNNETRDVTDELEWSSSDSSIATVTKQGLVTAVASSNANQGIVTITGTTINEISAEGEISVSDAAVTAINLKQTDPSSGTINTCIPASISGDISYEDGYTALDTVKDLNFSLDNQTTATISSDGTLYTSSKDLESTTITANTNGVYGNLTVAADPKNLGDINILVNDEATNLITLNVGERIQVNSEANLTNDNSDDKYNIDETISWTQESLNLVGITTTGALKGSIIALKPGVNQLIASCGGKETRATLEVKGDDALDSLQINDGSGTIVLAPSTEVKLTLTANYSGSTSSINVSEFANWSTNGSSLVTAELTELGTDEASYKITHSSDETGVAIISATYDNIIVSVHIQVE